MGQEDGVQQGLWQQQLAEAEVEGPGASHLLRALVLPWEPPQRKWLQSHLVGPESHPRLPAPAARALPSQACWAWPLCVRAPISCPAAPSCPLWPVVGPSAPVSRWLSSVLLLAPRRLADPVPLVSVALRSPHPQLSQGPSGLRSIWAGAHVPCAWTGQRVTCLIGSQGSVPPVMAFHLGSLGFLTPFNFEDFQSQVTQVIQGKLEFS